MNYARLLQLKIQRPGKNLILFLQGNDIAPDSEVFNFDSACSGINLIVKMFIGF